MTPEQRIKLILRGSVPSHGHPAMRWQSWDSNTGLPATKPQSCGTDLGRGTPQPPAEIPGFFSTPHPPRRTQDQ